MSQGDAIMLLPRRETRRDDRHRWMLRLRAVLCSVALVAAQQTPPPRVIPSPGEIPHIVACDKDGLLGDHIPIFGTTADLGQGDNSMPSMVF